MVAVCDHLKWDQRGTIKFTSQIIMERREFISKPVEFKWMVR
jgi:hypothetical protein